MLWTGTYFATLDFFKKQVSQGYKVVDPNRTSHQLFPLLAPLRSVRRISLVSHWDFFLATHCSVQGDG